MAAAPGKSAAGKRDPGVVAWDDTLGFGFPLDYAKGKKRDVSVGIVKKSLRVQIPTWVQQESGEDGIDYSAHSAFVSFLVFELLLKCKGDTATIVIDGTPPRAMASPMAADKSKKVNVIMSELLAAFRKPVSNAAAAAGSVLAQKLEHEAKATRRSAMIGSVAVVYERTSEEIGESSLLVGFDMYVTLQPEAGGVATIKIVYNATMFTQEAASVWLEMIEVIAGQMESGKNVAVGALEATTPRMIQQMNVQWQPKPMSIEPRLINRLMFDPFEDTVRTRCNGHPETQIAMIDPKLGRTVTYQEMSDTTTKLAAWLHQKLPKAGWGSTAVIGVHIPRQCDFYLSAFAVLKAGSAYLPLDPDFPPDRLAFALEDSESCALITISSLAGTLDFKGPMYIIDTLWDEINALDLTASAAAITPCPATPSSPAYLIYTSGSTGKPKGVLIEHRSIVNFIVSERYMYDLDNTHRVLQGASVSFDASQEEVWSAFGTGSALVLVDKQTMADPELFPKFLADQKITIISTVPSLLSTVPPKSFDKCKLIIVGGEACNQDLNNALGAKESCPLMNSYGPTEATVACMWQRLRKGKPVTIGQATPGNFVAIIGENKELLPPGVPGELIIAGPGVARGYVKRDELTNEKFVPCPYLPNEPGFDRMYHSGDLVRWKPDCGEVEFLGRIDCQVKLRGYRIELGEIESTMTQYPGVEAAVVALREKDPDQGPYLCGYVVATPELKRNFKEQEMRKFLGKHIPHYMVPSRICLIEEIPRSPAGKVDRKPLPIPPPIMMQQETSGPTPEGPMEQLVFNAWCEVLKGKTPATNMNFFEVGGQSLLAGQLSTRIRRLGFPDFAMKDVYANPTIQQQAAHLSKLKRATPIPTVTELPERELPSAGRKFVFVIWQLWILLLLIIIQAFFATVYAYAAFRLITVDKLKQDMVYNLLFCFVLLEGMNIVVSLIWFWLVTPAIKWAMLGIVQPGVHSIWSWYFLWWWTARALTWQFPLQGFMILGSPLVAVYLRLFGAKVGTGLIYCGNIRIIDADLLDIGDDVFIGDQVQLAASEIVDSMLVIRPITIGNCVSVGAKAVIAGGADVGERSLINPLALVQATDSVDHCIWSGAPGEKIGSDPVPSLLTQGGEMTIGLANPVLRRSTCHQITWVIIQFIFIMILGICTAAPYFVAFIGFVFSVAIGLPWYTTLVALWGCPVFIAGGIIVNHIIIFFFARVLFPCLHIAEGEYSVGSALFERKLMFDQLHRVSMFIAHPMYASMFVRPYLKMMGVKMGDNSECSNLNSIIPGQIEFGNGVFVADNVSVNPLKIYRGVFEVKPVLIQDRSFVGNGAALRPGLIIESDSLLGLASYKKDGVIEKNTTYLGNPAFLMPREKIPRHSDESTYNPSRRLQIYRFMWEFFRVTAPGFCGFYAFYISSKLFPLVNPNGANAPWTFGIIFAVMIPVWVVGLIFQVIFAIAAKWILIWRHKVEEHALHSHGVWRAELVVDLIHCTIAFSSLNFVRGSLLMQFLFRCLGTKIGSNCYLDSLYLPEQDLIEIGDGVCINENAVIQTHLFEDRVMKCDWLHIQDRVSIGFGAVILYKTVTGTGCTLASNSLVVKGESYAPMTHLMGIPAKRCAPPQVMIDGLSPHAKAAYLASVAGANRGGAVPPSAPMSRPMRVQSLPSLPPDHEPVIKLSMWLRNSLELADPDLAEAAGIVMPA